MLIIYVILALILLIISEDIIYIIRAHKMRKNMEHDVLEWQYNTGYDDGVNACIERVESMQLEAKEDMNWLADGVCENVLKELRKELELE